MDHFVHRPLWDGVLNRFICLRSEGGPGTRVVLDAARNGERRRSSLAEQQGVELSPKGKVPKNILEQYLVWNAESRLLGRGDGAKYRQRLTGNAPVTTGTPAWSHEDSCCPCVSTARGSWPACA